jgi:DNA repair exonuclease SbcCD ATPase subunit
MDQPFLVSFTGPEVSRFLNNVIRMDIIDTTLSNADKRKRQLRKQIESLNMQLSDTQTEIDSFAWLKGPVNDLISRLEVINDKKLEIDTSIEDIESGILHIEEWTASIPKISDWNRTQEIIDTLQINIEKRERINEEGISLKNQIEDYLEQKEMIPMWDIVHAQEIINDIDKTIRQREEVLREEERLSDQIETIKEQHIEIENCKEDMKNLQYRLPDVCPLCGAPMDKDSI